MKTGITTLVFLISIHIFAQQTLSLNDCYTFVETNYPLVKQNALLEKQNTTDLAVIRTERLPQFNVAAQATYQSDVIGLPIPNATSINKDQYRATLSANQLIYGGGMIRAALANKSMTLKTQQKEVEVNLYQLKKQVNQLYFSILLLQEKRALLTAKKRVLEAKHKDIKSGISNGVLLTSSEKTLEVELLKINQQFTEIDHSKNTLIKTLASFIGKPISSDSTLQNPQVTTLSGTSVTRPELDLFQLKKEQIESSEHLLSKQNSPKLIGFANGGYGNPGLNLLDNSFQTFYTVGVKLNWQLFDWNANKKKRESLAINKDIIDTQKEVFELNTSIELNQNQLEIEKLTQFISSDLEIIALQKSILKTAESQWRNGVITSSAYITEVTNLFEEQNNLNAHTIELQLIKANYNITKGN